MFHRKCGQSRIFLLAMPFLVVWLVWIYHSGNVLADNRLAKSHSHYPSYGRHFSRSLKAATPDKKHLDAFVLHNGNSTGAGLDTTKMAKQARLTNHIQSSCQVTGRTVDSWGRDYLRRHLIVDDKYRLIYCYVPKVGCANWKRVFNALYGDVASPDDVHKVNHTSMVYLSTYSETEIQYRLKHYFKFMFVRHPVDRLLSAYKNKFGEHFKEFEQKYGVKIVNKFRPNSPPNPKGDDVTFAEFLLYVASSKKNELNEHWSAYEDLCQPCLVSYDFVGFYEDFEEDVSFLLDALKLSGILHFPQKQAYYKPLSDDVKMEYIRPVPNSTMDKLVYTLSRDFDLFHYPKDDPLGRSKI